MFVENIFDTVKKSKAAKAAAKSLAEKDSRSTQSFECSYSELLSRRNEKNAKKNTNIQRLQKNTKKPVKTKRTTKSNTQSKRKRGTAPKSMKHTKRTKSPHNFNDDEATFEAAFILSSISQRSFDSFYNRFNSCGVDHIQIPTGSNQILASSDKNSDKNHAYYVMLDHNYYWISNSEMDHTEVTKPSKLIPTKSEEIFKNKYDESMEVDTINLMPTEESQSINVSKEINNNKPLSNMDCCDTYQLNHQPELLHIEQQISSSLNSHKGTKTRRKNKELADDMHNTFSKKEIGHDNLSTIDTTSYNHGETEPQHIKQENEDFSHKLLKKEVKYEPQKFEYNILQGPKDVLIEKEITQKKEIRHVESKVVTEVTETEEQFEKKFLEFHTEQLKRLIERNKRFVVSYFPSNDLLPKSFRKRLDSHSEHRAYTNYSAEIDHRTNSNTKTLTSKCKGISSIGFDHSLTTNSFVTSTHRINNPALFTSFPKKHLTASKDPRRYQYLPQISEKSDQTEPRKKKVHLF